MFVGGIAMDDGAPTSSRRATVGCQLPPTASMLFWSCKVAVSDTMKSLAMR